MPPITFILEKQPAEILPYSVDFTKRLPTGQVIQGTSTVVVTDDQGANVSGSMIVGSPTIARPLITVTLQAGTNGKDYLVTFTAQTQNYKFEEDVRLKVREKNLTSS
jgi:UDP-N-acetylmuramyl tripeptide synthase